MKIPNELKMQYTNVFSLPEKSQKNMFTLALLRVIGSSATAVTPCNLEIRGTKMT